MFGYLSWVGLCGCFVLAGKFVLFVVAYGLVAVYGSLVWLLLAAFDVVWGLVRYDVFVLFVLE